MQISLEQFEEILKFSNSEVIVRDSDGKIVRKGKIIISNNHFDWDKNKVIHQPYNKCRWNGRDKIFEWVEGALHSGSFTVFDNELIISSSKQKHNNLEFWYRIKVENGQITCGHFSSLNSSEPAPITHLYDILVIEKALNDFIKFINSMNINEKIKEILFDKVRNARFKYDLNYKNFRQDSPDLKGLD